MMIRIGIVWGLARQEMLMCRRLVRFWVFEAMAGVVGLAVYIYYMAFHLNISASSASAAILNPRFLFNFLGIYYLYYGFYFGLIFLGFDLRARDSRERMDEVIDSLPCSNLEWLLGRYLGIVVSTWLPLVAFSLILLCVGIPFGESPEPRSLLTFLVPMALPGSCFVLGLTFFVTLVVRHRLIVAFLLVAFLVGLIAANFTLVPIYLLPVTDLSGGFMVPDTSDIIPRVLDMRGFVQRSGVLLAGFAMLLLSAALYPRKDDSSRWMTALFGLIVLAGGIGLCGSLVLQAHTHLAQREAWKKIHQARSQEPAPDLLEMVGRIHIDPGRRLEADLDLRFKARSGETLSKALFSLNPGLQVREVRLARAEAIPFLYRNGLLEIPLERPLVGEEVMSVTLSMAGRPDGAFAYLDAALEPLELSVRDSRIFLLGHEPLIFEPRYVALLPGLRWLPASGTEIGRGDGRSRPTDFFNLDLTVDLPAGWLAAGPGRREVVSGGGDGARFRFAPPSPVPPVALVAGRLASASTRVGGVTLEVLLHPSHGRNLQLFTDARDEIVRWIAGRLEEAAAIGLDYPFEALTLVEIPSGLRGYAGSWRMDSALIQPAMILTREAGFPTARFDTRFRNVSRFEEQAGGVPRAKRDTLIRFFQNDFTGGSPFSAAARNLFGFQTAATGEDALVLDFVCEALVMRLLTERYGYFSVFHMGADSNQTVGRGMRALFDPTQSDRDMAQKLIEIVTGRAEVWDAVLKNSLVEVDPWENPALTLDVLTLKGGAMADSLLDGLGREKAARLLAELRQRHAGGAFDRRSMIEAGRGLNEELEDLLSLWIDRKGLPGFTLGAVAAWRLPDRGGSSQYQFEITVRNEEPTPGLVRLEYAVVEPSGLALDQTEPIHLPGHSAVQIGLVTSAVPQNVRVVPYLALNRAPFNVSLPPVDENRVASREPFSGWRAVDWKASTLDGIVVDDLDDGFAVEEVGEQSIWRLGGRGRKSELDEGIPVATSGQRVAEWSRVTSPDAYGKYRHTMAVTGPGNADRIATFIATIPRGGEWQLEYHLPRAGVGQLGGKRGTWRLTIVDSSGERTISFDADGGELGWNELAKFELPDGKVQVRISNATDGDLIIADAIRWEPVLAREHQGASR